MAKRINATHTGELAHGANPHAVISVIRARAARRLNGDTTADGRKLGLVIEGGGTRAVCSGGGAAALARLGYSGLFDEVYATSAGVMNASYFISNQPLLGISVYFENCCTRSFLNPLRFWKILDVDYIIDRVVAIEKPLNVKRLLESRTKFFVAAYDRGGSQGVVFDAKATQTPLLTVLKAAMAIPVLYNRSIEVDGRPCMDGGFVNPFPLQHALQRGCTDILVLLTRPAGFRERPTGLMGRLAFDFMCARGNRRMSQSHKDRYKVLQDLRDMALARVPIPNGVNIATICTDEPELVQRTTTDSEVLRMAAVQYGRKILRLFGADDCEMAQFDADMRRCSTSHTS